LPEYLNVVTRVHFIGKNIYIYIYSKAFLFEIKQQKERGILSPVTAMVLKLITIQLSFWDCGSNYDSKYFSFRNVLK